MGILLVDWQAQLSLSMVQQNDLSHFSSSGGGEGWADVWMKDHFAWEYKRKKRSLVEAYQQLLL